MRTFPASFDSADGVLLCIPRSFVPIIGGKIGELERRGEWATESDWQQGYQVAAWLEECLIMQCGVASLNELNVMLAHAIGLRNDSTSAADISEFLPATGAALQAAEAADLSNRLEQLSRLAREQDLLDLRGQFPQSWWQGLTNPPEYASLYDLYKTAATNGNIEVTVDGQQKNLWDWVKDNVVGTGSDLVDIVTDIIDVFGTGVDIAGDAAGDVLTGSIEGMTLLALLVQSQILLAVQTDQALTKQRLNDVVEALRGDSATADNILQALRGDVQASAARNVIDRIPDLAATQTALSDLLTAQQATTSAIPDLTTIETALAALDTSQQATTSAIPDLTTIETALAALDTSQQATTSAIPDLTTIETALAALDTSQQATTAAVNGLTLSADNITIDVTTLETRLDSLIDQVERLRGVTPDAAAANVDDVFQELNDLRGDVTTLMSTADSSSFMQIVDIVEAVSGAQKEVANFRKDFAVTDFCCDDTVITLPPEPDDTPTTQSDQCQRVQWYIDAGFNFLMELYDYNVFSINVATIESLYQKHFDIAPHEYDSAAILWYRTKTAGVSDVLAQYSFIQSASVDLDVDGNSIASVPGLLCSFYDPLGKTAAQAKILLDQLLNAYYGPKSNAIIPSVNESSRRLIESVFAGKSLNAFFAGTIPTDPADLTGYDNTACAVCGGSGGGCSFIAAGTSVDIASSGPYSIGGEGRHLIVWPVGWPADEGGTSWLNYPATRYVLDDECIEGLELSFPFDQASNDRFSINVRDINGNDTASVNILGSAGPFVVPVDSRELSVVRAGSGGLPYDRPFTLRVTRPA